jgi:ubiquinone/menaquinone biosynthesis C-methylase UbiE
MTIVGGLSMGGNGDPEAHQGAIDRRQFEHFKVIERKRFTWQMTNPLVMEREERLVLPLRAHHGVILEVGSGEGANVARLVDGQCRIIGCDFSFPRLQFCRTVAPDAPLAVADAAHLPFANDAVDVVFCRDVLHHLPDVQAAVREFFRVTKPGGRVILIEASGKNPIINLQARLLWAERGELQMSPERFLRLLRAHTVHPVQLEMAEPLPIDRLACHYRFGIPQFGQWRWSRALLHAASDVIGKLVPRHRWSYVIATATK